MLKVKNGKAKIEGRPMDIAVELTSLIKCIVESYEEAGMKREDADKFIRRAMELGLKSEKELREEANEVMKKVLSDLADKIKEIAEEDKANE